MLLVVVLVPVWKHADAFFFSCSTAAKTRRHRL